MRNGGRVLLAVRNLYVRKKFVWQSVAASIEELPDSKDAHSLTYCRKTVD